MQRLDRSEHSVIFEDISASGIGGIVGKAMKLGEKVLLTINIKQGDVKHSFVAVATVMNVVLSSDLFRCGFKFYKIADETKTNIERFVSSGVFNQRRSWLN